MIVNYTEQGWEIISQRAHGLLAASVAQQWQHSVRTSRWIETLIAIAEHDDAQVELAQSNLLTSDGGPLNFAMRKMDLQHCQETILRAYNKSTYIALMSSRHLDFLCDDAGANKEIKQFITEQQKQRKKWIKTVGLTTEQLEHDYQLLEWCDALSLLLCQNQIQPEGRAIEISKGPDGEIYTFTANNDGSLAVSPWPFHQDGFDIFCEARTLKQLSYKNNEEFKAAYQNCEPIIKTWTFKNLDQ